MGLGSRGRTKRGCGMRGANAQSDSAPCREFPVHHHFTRRAGRYQVIKDPIDDLLIEAARIPERGEVILQRLRFDAKIARHVIDRNPREIRLACHRAERSEIVALEANPVVAMRMSVAKRIERGDGGRVRKTRGLAEQFRLSLRRGWALGHSLVDG
jgi:hypothetical protein